MLRAVLFGLLAACAGGEARVATSTLIAPAPTVATPPTTPAPSSGAPIEAWSPLEAERHVSNFLAALAAGAYEQAGWSAENNDVAITGQSAGESPAEALRRQCAGGACAGPYTLKAVGPSLVDPDSGQASSTVTVTHEESGAEGTIRLATLEGQLIVADLPPLVPSAGRPPLVVQLFGVDLPIRLVVQRFQAFEIWEGGTSEWVTNWLAADTREIEGDVIAGSQWVAGLRDPQTTYRGTCPRLMTRDREVLVLDQCFADGWTMFEVMTNESRPTPIPFAQRMDGEYVWFAERAGTVVHGIGDAEGNLTALSTLQGVDVLSDDYAGLLAISTDGAFVAYIDHADPAALSHFWSPVVVVRDTATGAELGRFTLDNPVICLEFSATWLVACEADRDSLGATPAQLALAAIDILSGRVNRVETPTRVFLPT